jgi:hypothetical protein
LAQVRLAVDKDQPIFDLLDPVSRDCVVYLLRWDDRPEPDKLPVYRFGYHAFKTDMSGKAFPVAYVFVDDEKKRKREDWTITLSHEFLELAANPHLNLWILGPTPRTNAIFGAGRRRKTPRRITRGRCSSIASCAIQSRTSI